MLWPYMYQRTAYLSIVSIPSPCNTMFVSIRHVKGSFKNYVAKILPFFDQQPTSTWTFYTIRVVNNGYFWTTYPPHFVHVVIERPQKCPFETWTHPIYCMWSARLSPHVFMYVLYYPYYVYSNSIVLYYIREQLLDPLRYNILMHMYSTVDILGYPLLFFLLVP